MTNKKSWGRVPAPRDDVPAEVSPAMQEWAELWVACARDEGVSLTGEGGLLTAMIRQGHCCVKRARARSRSKYAEVPVSNWHQIAWKVRAPQSTGRPGHPRHAVASHNATEPSDLSAFVGFRFPPEVILLAVRWYLRFGLSYSDLEGLLAERGVDVDHVTLYRWVQRFIPLLIDAARPCRHAVGRDGSSMRPTSKSPACGGTYTGPWTSTAKSSTRSSRNGATSQRRELSSRRLCSRTANRRRSSPTALLRRRMWSQSCSWRTAQHRAVREQPSRVRPRTFESAATTDARHQDRPHRTGRNPRSRVHAEHPTRPLRTRR
jgi:hypothetical protein